MNWGEMVQCSTGVHGVSGLGDVFGPNRYTADESGLAYKKLSDSFAVAVRIRRLPPMYI